MLDQVFLDGTRHGVPTGPGHRLRRRSRRCWPASTKVEPFMLVSDSALPSSCTAWVEPLADLSRVVVEVDLQIDLRLVGGDVGDLLAFA